MALIETTVCPGGKSQREYKAIAKADNDGVMYSLYFKRLHSEKLISPKRQVIIEAHLTPEQMQDIETRLAEVHNEWRA